MSFANLGNLELMEELYERWRKNPSSVDPSWQHFFEGMQLGSELPKALPVRQESSDLRVYYLIMAYRTYGHLMARFNPLATSAPPLPNELKLESFGFSSKDLESDFPTGGFLKQQRAPLKDLIAALERTYCGAIGIEYMGLGSVEMEKWIQSQIEPIFPKPMAAQDKVAILRQLNRAEGFETFLHTKYVGQKRFSLEGEETFIPMLHAILEKGAEEGVSDLILGMAHRGRLNVLANIFNKSYEYIFEEFEDYYTPDLEEGTGDVKYHKGFGATYASPSGKKVQIVLAANPSHLESVDPVVEGGARAIQELKKPRNEQHDVVPLLVHGDAAVAGQGVVYETMGFSRLNGYSTRGTLHIVINNQIGFTTLPKDTRSTRYCTDIAKAYGAPVFHVNAEDPEGCVAVARMSIELRQRFGCDVFIDLVGYRKYGHNEGDEPSFTQPVEYQLIRSKKTIREIMRDRLIAEGTLSEAEAKAIEEEFKEMLANALVKVKSKTSSQNSPKNPKPVAQSVITQVDEPTIKRYVAAMNRVPEGFNLNPKIRRHLKDREEMLGTTLDWALGELLAYASLCDQGVHVRLSGQDVRRGTFSHRHGVWVDQVTSERYFPLSHIREGQAPCDIFNSSLSEMAVLGFEYGYSLVYPQSLVIWEAQFGDFANGAQVIIDQFIASSETKWGLSSNLTLLLPHGYEGQGAEHSSARIERFLQLAAENNVIIANCTTPAQFFHLLRRQGLSKVKKPLIIFTPKALLRLPECRSSLSEFVSGKFEEIIDDPTPNCRRLALCSGKIYYDLLKLRAEKKLTDMAFVRIEQLYPLNEEKMRDVLDKYKECTQWIWVQEEPSNMGAWQYIRPHLEKLRKEIRYVGRGCGASTAAGSHALHKLQHDEIVKSLIGEK